MEINLAIGVKVAQHVVELADRHAGVVALEMAKQFRQRGNRPACPLRAGRERWARRRRRTDFFGFLGQGTLRGKPMSESQMFVGLVRRTSPLGQVYRQARLSCKIRKKFFP